MILTTGDDAPAREPSSYLLFGSNYPIITANLGNHRMARTELPSEHKARSKTPKPLLAIPLECRGNLAPAARGTLMPLASMMKDQRWFET
ncbi:MAG: hypothetical protein K9N23_00180 [Akkermansiaceae bacterium]|nr:hypothetical protein [Akkermansiaceae bacterium]